MQIKTEDFAACRIINFYVQQAVITEGKAVLGFVQPAKGLMQKLLQIKGVQRCLITAPLISVKYNENADVAEMKDLVLAEIDDFMEENNLPAEIETNDNVSLEQMVEALADAFIRPTLYRDNGGINLVELKGNTLIMQFTGHCAGCPYAQNTLNNVVSKTLQKYLPQIHSVQIKE